jgi:hypothetical protein
MVGEDCDVTSVMPLLEGLNKSEPLPTLEGPPREVLRAVIHREWMARVGAALMSLSGVRAGGGGGSFGVS